ncbi:MAG: 30S ribosome-binding factor RbfA [Chloroflexota bacterium]
MSDGRRIQRVGTLLREELSRLLREAIADPRLGSLVTIARVNLSPDLEHATVAVSVLGDAVVQRAALAALTDASGYLRRELAGRMRLRHVPSLRFVTDEVVREGDRVLELLNNLPGSPAAAGERERKQDG